MAAEDKVQGVDIEAGKGNDAAAAAAAKQDAEAGDDKCDANVADIESEFEDEDEGGMTVIIVLLITCAICFFGGMATVKFGSWKHFSNGKADLAWAKDQIGKVDLSTDPDTKAWLRGLANDPVWMREELGKLAATEDQTAWMKLQLAGKEALMRELLAGTTEEEHRAKVQETDMGEWVTKLAGFLGFEKQEAAASRIREAREAQEATQAKLDLLENRLALDNVLLVMDKLAVKTPDGDEDDYPKFYALRLDDKELSSENIVRSFSCQTEEDNLNWMIDIRRDGADEFYTKIRVNADAKVIEHGLAVEYGLVREEKEVDR